MPFDLIAERRIREAMAQGEFDNLPGAGKPIDLEQYFRTPPDLRLAFSVLKNANCAPLEVELLNEIARLERAIADTADPAARRRLERMLADQKTRLAVLLESRRPGEK